MSLAVRGAKSMSKLPDINHVQFLVLSELLEGEQTGRRIREKLAEAGHPKNGPAFYQFMSRMEDAKLVAGWYDQKIVDSQIIKERAYRITGEGEMALREVREFYATRLGLGFQGA
jgi:DNA-binding PadR family transcriptional regulator